MPLRVVTPPAPSLAVVTLAEAKAHCRVEHGEDDAILAGCIAAAVDMAQAHAQRRFLSQTLDWIVPERDLAVGAQRVPLHLTLPVAPVRPAGVVSVSIVPDGAATPVAWPADQYMVRHHGPTVAIRPRSGTVIPLLSRDHPEPMVIRFVVGEDTVSPLVRSAVLLMVGDLYANRESTAAKAEAVPMATTVEAMLRPELWA